jgi:TRAP-type C4-dicarboxylate transport system substrate-binding protein
MISAVVMAPFRLPASAQNAGSRQAPQGSGVQAIIREEHERPTIRHSSLIGASSRETTGGKGARKSPRAAFGREFMTAFDRRTVLALAMAAGLALPAFAQEKPRQLRFSAVFSEQDIRAEMMKRFAEALGEGYALETYFGGNLFKQGTELVAIQRGNLEMGNIAPQDVANQIPSWSILSSAYLFRDANHLRTFFESEAGEEMKSMAEEQLGIHILGPTFFGTRHVGLVPDRRIETPEDMAGIRLRMPPGEAWQFLGQALGANPTAMAYAEVYTGLQTGAIDGQDNPLPNVRNMKFYEVMSQIALTSHLVGYDLLVVSKKVWDALSPEEQQAFQAAADGAIAWSTEQHLQQEEELKGFFEEQGLKVYTPNVEAFRKHAQQMYLESDLAKSWPEGMLNRINAL